MSAARPVRVARAGASARQRVVRVAAPRPSPPPAKPSAVETRENVGATRRAWRLSIAYAVGIAAVFTALAVSARLGPAGTGAGTTVEVELSGLVAGLLIVAGVLVSLGAAPRRVLLGPVETVVVGRFGRAYRFPAREALTVTVLQRHGGGIFSRDRLQTVELSGGSSRRSFLLDEGLLAAHDAAAPDPPA